MNHNRIQFISLFSSYFSVAMLMLFSICLQAQKYEQVLNLDKSVSFIENKGQVSNQKFESRPDVLFSGESKNLVFHLRNDGVSYQLYQYSNSKFPLNNQSSISNKRRREFSDITHQDSLAIFRTDINWIDTKTDFTIIKGTSFPGYNNYYLPVCPDGVLNVKSYESVTYKNIYDGIDVKWYDKDGLLEYDYIVSSGSNYNKIKWEVVGAKSVRINELGELVLETPFGKIIESKPIAYQGENEIDINWLIDDNIIGFDIKEYNKDLTLVIDPITRIWGTYYGGPWPDYSISCTVDDSSNVFIAGRTRSTTLIATTGSFQTSLNGFNDDAFLAKFNNNGVRQWSTYYGGFGNDEAWSCATDKNLNIYIAGWTFSSSVIASSGSHQTILGGDKDAFLAKFSKNGSRLWGTYYGGDSMDLAYGCYVDANSNILLTGSTKSDSSIASSGSFQSSLGGEEDAYLAKFNSSGTRLWGTYYGGPNNDFSFDCVSDTSSNIFLFGETSSTTGISSIGAHQSTHGGGGNDAFIVKFDSNGMRQWATYYGGSKIDGAQSGAIDVNQNLYVTGYTYSASSIATSGTHKTSINSTTNFDAFLVKFNTNGSRTWGTYYGGPKNDFPRSCDVDKFNNVYISGDTPSASGISTTGSHQTTYGGNGDGFLAKFNSLGKRKSATYYGGAGTELGWDAAISPSGNAYFTGLTVSNSGISTSNGHQSGYGGIIDAFLVKFKTCAKNGSTISVNACFSYLSPSKKNIWTTSGVYRDKLKNIGGCDSILTINLTIDTVDNIVSQFSDSLVSNASPGTYQWLDCNNNFAELSGDTNKYFKALNNGNYAVVINQNGCIDTSACYEITGVGIQSLGSVNGINFFPNPANDHIYFLFGEENKLDIEIVNNSGQIVLKRNDFKDQSLSVEHIPNGIYLMRIIHSNQVQINKIIIQH